MLLETVTSAERDYVLQMLSERLTELLHELHHASSREFKARLRRELELNESLRQKLAA